ncbi:DUF481 domain-containing protein [Flammeovirga yaeyamensis]|uniref:DUF481 domain-containing protein n=1 Tax=Flammeovirga yaeyamensis TaxID=367791 RepID=A0AAX1N9I7_9BACT|nr:MULTISPECIES: DUF481 domain-containing protein [Flammeovirga]ANQ49408.2 DUF481 domain-containing protein [Flammeovirga sp. MY04]MBB3697706.1 small nuclear ribonucleoprotein (snRNP)-like protein [Flammeovirga yaeyamensis]NMF35935.1 DUF481 domain-containing protein [Flammeovirga yaeyamensis]QWG03116.1 DUF481 domain-containing protein [Flammeovirga yaeyamensis]
MDSLEMINGDVIVGEIKSLDRGVVEIETDYSDANFKIEWDGIKKIICNTKFSVTLSNGDRYYGSIVSSDDGLYKIISDDSVQHSINPKDVVYLKSINQTFLSKLSASVDVGYNFTKANNLSQLNTNIFIAYNTNKWILTLNVNSIRSVQDNVDPIVRDEGSFTGNYFLPKDFYATASISYLTNTEQSINLRLTTSGGFGKYVLHTNKAYWGFSTGVSVLNESFNQTLDEDGNPFTKASTTSSEWYLGTDLNLFDIGDLSFNATGKGYRSLDNNSRWRVDAGANLKYDLPYDFYIKTGYKMNFDTQPAEAGKELDYQYTLGFGWEL